MLTRPVRTLKLGRRKRGPSFDELKASIADIGLINPIVIDSDRNVLNGGQCVMAMRELGIKEANVWFHSWSETYLLVRCQRPKAQRARLVCIRNKAIVNLCNPVEQVELDITDILGIEIDSVMYVLTR